MTARYRAVKALVRQEKDGYANLVLDAELGRCDPPLPARDAAFAARIFYTVLERRNLLDWTLDRFLKKPVSKLDAPVRAVLRAGLAQAVSSQMAQAKSKMRSSYRAVSLAQALSTKAESIFRRRR